MARSRGPSESQLRSYLGRVEAILAAEFGWDESTRRAFANCRGRMGAGIPDTFEFICDSPVVANWRLKPDRDAGPWGLRMADYAWPTSLAAGERAQEITRRMASAQSVLAS